MHHELFKMRRTRERLNEPGSIPPRILRDIINDASFNDDQISVEYFGGVLSSSRSPHGRDDRGAVLTSLLSRLSTYQMRSHYIFYAAIRQAHKGSSQKISQPKGRTALGTLMPLSAYVRLMSFSSLESADLGSILEHTTFGLDKEALLSNFQYGTLYAIHSSPAHEFRGVEFRPTVLGTQLFLSAHGLGHKRLIEYLAPELALKSLDGIMLGEADAFPMTAAKRNDVAS